MKIVASQAHHLHAPSWDLSGGQFVLPYQKPERVDIVRSSLGAEEFGPTITPSPFGDETTLAVYDADYLAFLKTAYGACKELGVEGDPTPCVWPRGRMRADSSDSIVAKFGRYCLAVATKMLPGSHFVEPPTSTMSGPIGRTKTRMDALRLA